MNFVIFNKKRLLTILSKELKTKLHRHTIKAQANGPSAKKSKPWKAFCSSDRIEDQPRKLCLHNSLPVTYFPPLFFENWKRRLFWVIYFSLNKCVTCRVAFSMGMESCFLPWKTKLHRHTIKAQANGPSAKKSKPWKAFCSSDRIEDQPRKLCLHNSLPVTYFPPLFFENWKRRLFWVIYFSLNKCVTCRVAFSMGMESCFLPWESFFSTIKLKRNIYFIMDHLHHIFFPLSFTFFF